MPSEDEEPTLADQQFDISMRMVAPGTKVFGHIRLERELGRGGMGVVWLAHDELIDLPIALKFLPDVVARDAEATDDLKRELRRGLTLTHPGIVRVYRFEQDATGAAIAMEYVDGPTLSSLKSKQPDGCFDPADLQNWIEQFCVALDYAHQEAQIVHRDLKPRNLMLTSKGKLKIADFGVATSIADTVSRVSIAKSGSGTPAYMSPQQALGGDPSALDDVYSLGATIYELVTGRPPFYQGNILAQVQQRVPPRMSERRTIFKILNRPEIPESWESTIASCLAKNPEDRPQSAKEVFDCLRGVKVPPVSEMLATQYEPLAMAELGMGIANSDTTKSMPGSIMSANPPAEDQTQRGRPVVAPAPTPQPAAPAAPRKSSPAAWVLLGVLVGACGAVWWWQTQLDQRFAAAELLRQTAQLPPIIAPTKTETPVATATPVTSVSSSQISESKDSDNELSEREANLMAEGKLPSTGQPWQNSLQMKFVPVSGTRALFSIFETRIDDYREFAQETKCPWILPDFEQGPTHPVVNVSWDDAQMFCRWLTDKERAEGRLGSRQRYRLPTDEEWSRAVDLPSEGGATPSDRHQKIMSVYPWGTEWPPPVGAGNYMSAGDANPDNPVLREIESYRDGFSHTAPAAEFAPNRFGIYDLGGNAWEWVEDWFDGAKTTRTMRGASWIFDFERDYLSSSRKAATPTDRFDYFGFRVVLDPGPQ